MQLGHVSGQNPQAGGINLQSLFGRSKKPEPQQPTEPVADAAPKPKSSKLWGNGTWGQNRGGFNFRLGKAAQNAASSGGDAAAAAPEAPRQGSILRQQPSLRDLLGTYKGPGARRLARDAADQTAAQAPRAADVASDIAHNATNRLGIGPSNQGLTDLGEALRNLLHVR